MSVKVVSAAAAMAASLFLLPPAAPGQQGGASTPAPAGNTTPGGGGGGSTPNVPGRGPDRQPSPTVPQPSQQQTRQEMRPIFLSGTVTVDGGGVPPERVSIESVCNGARRIEGYTDSKGRFSFQLGQQNNGVFQDASIGRIDEMNSPLGNQTMGANTAGFGSAERLLMNCELQARLAGYKSDIITLANRKPMDNPDVGMIFLQKLGPVEGRMVSATNMAAPKDAKKAFEKGEDALKKKKKPEDALKNLQKAVELYPQYASAWAALAEAQVMAGNREEARKSLQHSIEADPKYLPPYMQLASLQLDAQEWAALATTTEQALKLDPYGEPHAYLWNAYANFNTHNLDAAEKSARAGTKMDTRHQAPKIWHLLGVILASKRDYQGAAVQLRSYLQFAPKANDVETVRRQLAEIEKLQGAASLQ